MKKNMKKYIFKTCGYEKKKNEGRKEGKKSNKHEYKKKIKK